MHLHFGRPARPDPETAPQPEPEPRVGLEPPIGLEPQVDVALALESRPESDADQVVPPTDDESRDVVPPIDEGAGPEPQADEAASPAEAGDSSGWDVTGDEHTVPAPTGDGSTGDGSADAAPAGEATDDQPIGDANDAPTSESTADAWPDVDPLAPDAASTPARRSGRNGDPAPVGLIAPTPPSGWTDPMTSADGPHYWDRLISSERDRIRRYHRPATVVFIELANLDRLGALWGDDVAAQALIRVGRTLMQQIRSSDHAARIDMGRFAVFLPETNEIAAINFVERVRASIDASLGFMDETLQVGIGWASPADGDIDAAVTIAERRLDADLGRD